MLLSILFAAIIVRVVFFYRANHNSGSVQITYSNEMRSLWCGFCIECGECAKTNNNVTISNNSTQQNNWTINRQSGSCVRFDVYIAQQSKCERYTMRSHFLTFERYHPLRKLCIHSESLRRNRCRNFINAVHSEIAKIELKHELALRMNNRTGGLGQINEI